MVRLRDPLEEALDHGVACPVDLEATHASCTGVCYLEELQAHALK